jgi:hypothetical protein
VKQAQIDAGARPGVSRDDRRRLVELERELRRANAILKTASASCGGARRPIGMLVKFIDEHRYDTIHGRGSRRSAGCLSEHGCPEHLLRGQEPPSL